MADFKLNTNGTIMLRPDGKWALNCECCPSSGYWCYGYNLAQPNLLIKNNPNVPTRWPDKVLTQVVFSVSGVPNIWTQALFKRHNSSTYHYLLSAIAGLSTYNRSYVLPVHAANTPPPTICSVPSEFYRHTNLINRYQDDGIIGDNCMASQIRICRFVGVPERCCERSNEDVFYSTCCGKVGPFQFENSDSRFLGTMAVGSVRGTAAVINAPSPGIRSGVANATATYHDWRAAAGFTGDFTVARTVTINRSEVTDSPFGTPPICDICAHDGTDPDVIPLPQTSFSVTYTCTPTWSDPPA
jgi:hypothetical protein